MMKTLLLVSLLTLVTPGRAFADITGFIGVNTTPTNRQTSGFAVGVGLLIVGFEFEYSGTREDVGTGSPSLKFGMGSVLLQTPVAIGGFQPYFETGAGFYSEALGARTDSGFAFGTGGGVKISLAGPLRLRVDYRGIKLGSGALASPAHRIYAGVNLKF